MAQTSWPFENADTTETQYSALFSKLQTTGVAGDIINGQDLRVIENTGMSLNVSPGFALVRGFAYQSTAIEPVTLLGGESQPRIDLVILRLDPTANSIVLAVKKGTAAASPSVPALTQVVGGVWEFPLAQVAVATNATAIGPGDITDVRLRLGQQVGIWKTLNRPTDVTTGLLGYNSSLDAYEYWNGTAWEPLGEAAGVYAGVRTVASTALITLTPSDVGKLIVYTGGQATTCTLFGASLQAGSRIDFIQDGTFQITFEPGAGNTLQSVDGKRKTSAQYAGATAIYLGSNSWRLIGDLSA